MQTPKWFYIVIAACAVIVTGCESDAKKLARLRTEQTIACLVDQSNGAKLHDMNAGLRKPGADSQAYYAKGKTMLAAHDRCELAIRDLNLFMNGR